MPLIKKLTQDQVTAVLDRLGGLPHDLLLVGGVAMWQYGSDRLTDNVDVVALEPPPKGLKRKRLLSFGGEVLAGPQDVDVNWIWRLDEWSGLYEEAAFIDRGRRVHGIPIRVVSADYLVVMKMVAGRPKDEQDILFLLQSDEIDRELIRHRAWTHLGAFGLHVLENYIDRADREETT